MIKNKFSTCCLMVVDFLQWVPEKYVGDFLKTQILF